MRLSLLYATALFLLAGCAAVSGPGGRLVVAEPSLVTHCEPLGVVAETADAGNISVFMARRSMVRAVAARAEQLGGTHLVWLHRTDTSAAAKIFDCSP